MPGDPIDDVDVRTHSTRCGGTSHSLLLTGAPSDDDEAVEIDLPIPEDVNLAERLVMWEKERERLDRELAGQPVVAGRPVRRSRIWSLLSVDGGGMRGLVAALVLAEIEVRAGRAAHQLFRIGAGTSTGSLLVAAALGRETPLAARDVAALYEELGPKVFGDRWLTKTLRLWHQGDRYAQGPLRKAVEEVLGDLLFADARKRLIVTTTDPARRAGVVYDNRPSEPEDCARIDGLSLADVVMASTAAPGYLPPVVLGDRSMVDGGLWANNPAEVALDQIRDRPSDHGPVGFIVSLGTGAPEPATGPRGLKTRSGRRQTFGMVADIVGALPTERLLGRLMYRRAEVVRIQATLPVGHGRLDASTPVDLARLKEAARRCIDQHDAEIGRVVEVLRALADR